MFVRKRSYVQKSFRLDSQIENDLALLAEATEKSQNEIVNESISETLQDNKLYFLRYAVMEHFIHALESGEDCEPFELGELKVSMSYGEEDNISFDVTVKVDDKKNDTFAKTFDVLNDGKKIKEFLIGLSIYLEASCDFSMIEKYLADRTDYRNYVKIRK